MEKTKKMTKKVLSVIMAILMLIVSIPMYAYATGIEAPKDEEQASEGAFAKSEVIVLGENESLREENIKYFDLSDGTSKAVMYSEPVHYKNSEGKWVDIDNALTLNGSEYSAKNKLEIKFANKSGSSGLLSIKDSEYKIDFTPLNTNKVSVEIENAEKNNSRKFDDVKKLTSLISKARYSNIYDGVDIEYILVGNNVKENIIVKEKRESYSYSYELKLNKLNAELINGAIILSDSETNEAIYKIPAPYMLDANGEYSEEVEYTLTKDSKWKYTFTVTASKEWINKENRAFPITIDPIVEANTSYIEDYTTDTSYAVQSYIGSLLVSNNTYSVVSFNNLPSIPDSAYITEAIVSLNRISGTNSYVGAYEVVEIAGGEDAICFSTAPLDYNHITENSERYSWNITELISTTSTKISIGFKLAKGNESATFASESSQSEMVPALTISYRDMKGTEEYWSYASQSVGLAGNGYVNLATGNLVFEIPTLTTTENIFGYTPTMIYNSALATQQYKYPSAQVGYWYTYTANGFKLNMTETLVKDTFLNSDGIEEEYYVLADADGTEHYFIKSSKENEENIYYDEDGLQLKLETELLDNGNDCCKIVDGDFNERIFYALQGATVGDGAWYLSRIRDKSGNELRFYLDGAKKPNDIKLTPSGTIETTVMLSPLYNSDGCLTLIWCKATGEGVLFRHSETPTGALSATRGRYLREALYVKCDSSKSWPDLINFIGETDNEAQGITVNAVMRYEYDAQGYLTAVHDTKSDYKVEYTYNDSNKVSYITEYGKNNEKGQCIFIDYLSNRTEVQTSGADDVLDILDENGENLEEILNNSDDIVNIYVFDKSGRVTTTYSTNYQRTYIYGATNGEYDDSNSNTQNKIKLSTVTGSISPNYLLNGNFELSHTYPAYWNIENNNGGYVEFPESTSTSVEWNNTRINLKVNKNGQAEITQNVELSPGNYTFSLNLNSYKSYGLSMQLKATATDTSGEEFIENISSNRIYASGSGSFASLSFKVNETKIYKIGVYVTGDSNVDDDGVSVKIDNLMLSKSTGAQNYSWLNNGSFEKTYTAISNGVGSWVLDENCQITQIQGEFYKSLRINGAVDRECIAEQILFECSDTAKAKYDYLGYPEQGTTTNGEVFQISGFAYAPNAMSSQNSTFALKVEAKYYGENDAHTQLYGFNPKVDGWQYITGTFVFAEHKLLEELKVSCVYSNNYGTAYFDNITFKPADEVNPETTQYYYYDDGKLKAEKSGFNTSYYHYNTSGDLSSVISNKQRILYDYDSKHRVSTQRYYKHNLYVFPDSDYEQLNQELIDNEILKSRIDYIYNEYGMVTWQRASGSDKNECIDTLNTYDTKLGSKIFGALVKTETTLGDITRYFYDSNSGRLIANIQTDGTGTYYEYDSVGNLISVKPATYSSSTYQKVENSSSVEYVYNSNNKLDKIIVDDTEYSFTYDAFGNQQSVLIGDTVLVSQESNDYNGKITKAIYANGTTVLYEYDELGRTTKVTYQATAGDETTEICYEYEYDSNGNLTKYIDGKSKKTTIYQYDLIGRLVKYIEYDNETMLNEYSGEYSYDEDNRLIAAYYAQDYTYSLDSTSVLRPFYYYGYNEEDGSLKSMRLLMSEDECIAQLDYTYDGLSRFASKILSSGNVTSAIELEYLSASSIVTEYKSTVSYNGTSTSTNTFKYTYDEGNENITEIKDANNDILYKYTYDTLDRLVREDNSVTGKTYAYTYDNNGDILTEKVYSYTLNSLTGLTPLNTYTYGYTASEWADQLTSYRGGAITYDQMGNPLTYWDGTQFTWENINNLAALNRGYLNVLYTYNDEGIRTSKTVDGITHTYTLEGSRILSETFRNYLIIYVYDEAGSPIGMLCRTTSLPENMVHKYFFTKNLQGDIIGIVNSNGELVVEYTYNAWGECTTIVNNSSYSGIAQYNPFRYRGYYYDEESGYYYLNSRYYDPQTKRFLNSDDIGVITATPEGLTDKNLYAYCDNNPVMRSDTGGEFWNWIVGAVVGAVVGFVGQVISDVITSAINGEITISNWQTYTGAVVGGAVGGAIL